jgi:Flp pilus assembly protein TadD
LQIGKILYQQGELDRALAEYQWATRLKPDDQSAIEGTGLIYLAQQNYYRAIVDFRRLTELAPNNPRGYHNLGLALKGRNRDKEAIAALEQASKLYKNDGNQEQANQVTKLIEEINQG